MKKVSLRIRKQYFDDIVAGRKTIELRSCDNYWIPRLLANKPKIATFVCGKRIHRRYIIGIDTGRPEDFLKRKLSKQGMKDVGPYCIAIWLGRVVKESDHVSGGGTEQ